MTEEKHKPQKSYYERNKEKCKERNRISARAYYHRNKEAVAERAKKWREINKDYIVDKQREAKRKRKEEAILYLGGYCTDCERRFHPSVYEFHHIYPEHKDKDPSKMLQLSWQRIKDELDKCVLLCANCHRLRHHSGNY